MSESISYDGFEINEEAQEYAGDLPSGQNFSHFPSETPTGILAAWTFISDLDNAAGYEQFEVEKFKLRVQHAVLKKGVSLRQAPTGERPPTPRRW
ncbi:MAG TPA: DUF6582 domain-containing protein [Thermomicrobiales bacterium]|nr:DUF6582 domain-containing protein [Thermomicrobiales bacterium]